MQLKKKIAIVSCDREINLETLCQRIEKQGYTVSAIDDRWYSLPLIRTSTPANSHKLVNTNKRTCYIIFQDAHIKRCFILFDVRLLCVAMRFASARESDKVNHM